MYKTITSITALTPETFERARYRLCGTKVGIRNAEKMKVAAEKVEARDLC